MYMVNEEQIQHRLQFIPIVVSAMEQLIADWQDNSLLHSFALERALHLAIEVVTDIGSDLIDGFMMREASSYEDIITVIAEEQVCSEQVAQILQQLVANRKQLVQQYTDWERGAQHHLLQMLPNALRQFSQDVNLFVEKELAPFRN